MERKILCIAILLVMPVCAHAERSVVLEQEDLPLEILKYSASFEEQTEEGDHPDQIRHMVRYKNISGKEITAIRFGLVTFSASNAFIAQAIGVISDTLKAGEIGPITIWLQRSDLHPSFKQHGTAVIYVGDARFADGSVWRTGRAPLLGQLRKFSKSLKMKDLQERSRKLSD